MKTRITDLLGIEIPVIQGGMQHLGVPSFASLVSEAGGAGTVNRTCYGSNEEFEKALDEMNALTSRPYIVNISLLPDASVGDDTLETIRICGRKGVKAIETAGTNPANLVDAIHEAGIVHIHKVPAVRYALSAQKAGVDAVTVVGYECGGHPGRYDVGSIVLTRKAAKELEIPLIAGGGYADGYGLAAALCMGADGVVMGTRFVATKECLLHDNFKQLIVNATENDTLLCQQSIRNAFRVADNGCARECLELEAEPPVTIEKLMPVISGQRQIAAFASGDTDDCMFPMGMSAGLVEDVPTVGELMKNIKEEYEQAVATLTSI
ncbi:MAG: nitronate monooxygenase family protein [Eubacterium sp.]|nr:nitronate monooxygenase family protein [Eubacterium sp.]